MDFKLTVRANSFWILKATRIEFIFSPETNSAIPSFLLL
jgi:hypothetical protein